MAVFGGGLKQGRLRRDFQEGGNCLASPPGIELIIIIVIDHDHDRHHHYNNDDDDDEDDDDDLNGVAGDVDHPETVQKRTRGERSDPEMIKVCQIQR